MVTTAEADAMLPHSLALAGQIGSASIHAAGADRVAKANNDAKLREMLKGSELKSQEAQQAIQDKIGGLKQLNDSGMVPDGGSASVEGISVGADPYAKLMGKTQQGGAHAIEAAQKVYNTGVAKIAPTVQAASEGLALSNDPKNIGSMGQARTLMLKAMGMNRYNEQEAKAVLPGSTQGLVADFFNRGGDDMTPLNDSQRRSLNTFFKNQLHQAKQNHDNLKAQAMNMYNMSPYFDAARGSQLQGSMGAPVDTQLGDLDKRFASLPDTQTPTNQRPAPVAPLDKLRAFFTGGSSGGASPSPAAQDSQTKQVGGKTYIRVNGGWQEQ